MADIDDGQSAPELTVDWAPAYELLVSLAAYVSRRIHPHLELGEAWVREVRGRLPADFAQVHGVKHKDDCLLQVLAFACPGERDVDSYLGWLAGLSAGDAYDVLCGQLPESGPRLPRDFVSWRERIVRKLHVWNECYFRQLDPAILDGLQREAHARRALIGSAAPEVLVEDATNGMCPEPSPELRRIVLVPQYHQRPYNDQESLDDGAIFLYPADVVSQPSDVPPTNLLRLTRGLGDESRLRILRFLADGPSTLTEVARFAGLSQPTVHHHLAMLRAAGLVRVHCPMSGPGRYSLRPGAVNAVANQLDSYLEPQKGVASDARAS